MYSNEQVWKIFKQNFSWNMPKSDYFGSKSPPTLPRAGDSAPQTPLPPAVGVFAPRSLFKLNDKIICKTLPPLKLLVDEDTWQILRLNETFLPPLFKKCSRATIKEIIISRTSSLREEHFIVNEKSTVSNPTITYFFPERSESSCCSILKCFCWYRKSSWYCFVYDNFFTVIASYACCDCLKWCYIGTAD